jgi:hypothetical protein
LVLYDTDGGYRLFLGADPQGALELGTLCRERVLLTESHVASPDIAALGIALAAPFVQKSPEVDKQARARAALDFQVHRFHPQMLDWVAKKVSQLVMEEGTPPGEIAILAPFLSDALRFSLGERLGQYGISVRTHRPSRELSEEPAARCLLTLAKLAHPTWQRPPPPADVAQALMLSIAELDPVRARLLTDIVYRVKDHYPALLPFHQIIPETQERISYLLGGRYDELWQWMQAYLNESNDAERLDHFLSHLFGGVLSQAGFGFHRDLDAGVVAANLIESLQKFRKSLSPLPTDEANLDLGLEYVDMVEQGVVAAQYISSWQTRPQDALLLVPAYTFLMMNQAVTIQFWLDAGSRAWFERIFQPLTHPYVLRRDWPEGEIWTDEDEVKARNETLSRLILGLSRRCRKRIYLAFADLNERGYEQQGPLLQAVQRLLRSQGGADDA